MFVNDLPKVARDSTAAEIEPVISLCKSDALITMPLMTLVCWCRWYSLKAKPGSKKLDQNRGEIEVTATFLVQQTVSQSQSSLSIEKKTKKSLSVRNLAHTLGTSTVVSHSYLSFSLELKFNVCRPLFIVA